MRIYFFLLLVFNFSLQSQSLLDSIRLDSIYPIESISEALKDPSQVIKLVLRKQKLKEFPKEIFLFKNLQYLDLGKNSILEIPDSISKLKNLQYLDVSRNKLERISMKIGELNNLFYLNLNNNNLIMLPPQIGKLESLRTLDLWSNNLEDLPETISNLKNLKTIDLRVILFSDEKQKTIQSYLPNTTIHFSPSCNCKW